MHTVHSGGSWRTSKDNLLVSFSYPSSKHLEWNSPVQVLWTAKNSFRKMLQHVDQQLKAWKQMH